MSDTPPPLDGPPRRGGGPEFLTRRVGPFEVRIWLVLIVAGGVLGLLIRRRTSSGPADLGTEDGTGVLPNLTGGVALGPVQGGAAGELPEETNQSWLIRAAQLVMQHGGYDPAEVDAALRKALIGDPVTQREAAIYSLALRLAGTPPEDVPPLTMLTEPTSPTVGPSIPVTPTPAPPTSTPVQPATPAPDPNVAKFNRAVELKAKLNNSVRGGPAMTDAELLEAATFFTTDDPTIDPLARFYWRIWLDQHGGAGKFTGGPAAVAAPAITVPTIPTAGAVDAVRGINPFR